MWASCPVRQMNVEAYQGKINKTYGTKFEMLVVYYSQLMSVAYGSTVKETGLDGQVIRQVVFQHQVMHSTGVINHELSESKENTVLH